MYIYLHVQYCSELFYQLIETIAVWFGCWPSFMSKKTLCRLQYPKDIWAKLGDLWNVERYCTYMHIYIYLQIYIYVILHIYLYTYMNVNMRIYIYAYICMCLFSYIFLAGGLPCTWGRVQMYLRARTNPIRAANSSQGTTMANGQSCNQKKGHLPTLKGLFSQDRFEIKNTDLHQSPVQCLRFNFLRSLTSTFDRFDLSTSLVHTLYMCATSLLIADSWFL